MKPGYLRPLVPEQAPEKAEPWTAVMADIERVVMSGVTHWHSPRFHAYFPTANSYPSIVADMLSGAIACIGFTWVFIFLYIRESFQLTSTFPYNSTILSQLFLGDTTSSIKLAIIVDCRFQRVAIIGICDHLNTFQLWSHTWILVSNLKNIHITKRIKYLYFNKIIYLLKI